MVIETIDAAAYVMEYDYSNYTRDEWMAQAQIEAHGDTNGDNVIYGYHAYLVYVGEGFCPLEVAVLACNADAALQAAWEYLTEDRPEEVWDEETGEELETPLHIERIPRATILASAAN